MSHGLDQLDKAMGFTPFFWPVVTVLLFVFFVLVLVVPGILE